MRNPQMIVVISPRTACRYLREIQDQRQHFHTKDGKALKSLIELACYLKACERGTFNHHVSRAHNHFSQWVDNIVLDHDLADQMSLVLDKNPMRVIVMKRINILVYHATRTPRGREKARMILENALLPEEHFITNDGRTLRNLWELKEFLDTTDDGTFSYHISPYHNDFYDWISEILMDFELASRIIGILERQEIANRVAERLFQLEAFHTHDERHSIDSYVRQIKSGNSTCA